VSEDKKMGKSPAIHDLPTGHKFAPINIELSSRDVMLYLESVQDDRFSSDLPGWVPPTSLAAYALGSILNEISLPGGSLHASQEISLSRGVMNDEVVTFNATLVQNSIRKNWRFLSIEFVGEGKVLGEFLKGKTLVLIPVGEGEL